METLHPGWKTPRKDSKTTSNNSETESALPMRSSSVPAHNPMLSYTLVLNQALNFLLQVFIYLSVRKYVSKIILKDIHTLISGIHEQLAM